MKNIISGFLYILILNLVCISSFAQPGSEAAEIKKPDKYENRKLGSEKTGDKKFTFPRKVMQNTFTHYNYYFNANNRLNDVVDRAKLVNKDDYSQLLSFYNYSLDVTSQDKSEIDSVIYKCTAGILLHDLRNSWIDNMYLVLAKAYFFRKDLDSAGMTLQYINFSFAPKEAGGYDIPIGSSASNESGEFSIATKEKKSIWTELTSRPPSRNESFIWQIRNHIELNELPEAAGVIEILRHDPNFPKRLGTDLNEVISYWFYKQQVYDSSAYYLSKVLNETDGRQEHARWEFLIGQMYQLANKPDEAIKYYDRAIRHTHDPILDVYARLNSIRINKDNDKKDFLQQNINELLKLAKKDKYENYRDIIYYSAAKMELERKGYAAAEGLLQKSIKYSTANPAQRSQSFLLLADINYDTHQYPNAYNYYDSTDINVLALQEDKDRATLRKPPLKTISDNSILLYNQDSLQALAKLPAEQRDAIIKKKAKQLRKEQGLKEEDTQSSNPAVRPQADNNLFGDNTKSGDFYFYNASMKARGFSEFKSRWGDRPNVDNWRRQTSIRTQSNTANLSGNLRADDTVSAGTGISYEALLSTLPISPEKLAASNKSIMDALFSNGQTFQVKLEDYPSAILAYEEMLRRFPDAPYKEEALFNLIYCYKKTGDVSKSEAYRKELLNGVASNKWVQLLKNPNAAEQSNLAATKKYEDIYNLFIEGSFDRAKTEKKAADSVYGKTYWTPQLLYIEAIYYVKQKDDSTAINSLSSITSLYPNTPMADKAKTMIDVLGRRQQIEDELTKLNITRAEERPVVVNNKPVVINNNPVVNNPVVTVPPKDVKKDTTVPPVVKIDPPKKDSVIAPAIVSKNFTFVPTDAHYVVVLLDKVDQVYASEAKNAFNRYNQQKFYNQKIEVSNLALDDRYVLVLQGPFPDANAAVTYVDNTKPITGSRILPWLKGDKYSFLVISAANLDVLKTNKDMTAYKQLLQQAFPGKF